MADSLSIYSRSGVHNINLLGGTYMLRDGSWGTSTPQTATDYLALPYGAQPVFQNYLTQVETMDLVAQNGTHSTITAAQRDISEALREAQLYHQHPLWTVHSAALGAEAVWLRWNIDGEAVKQSLIYEGSLAALNEQCVNPFISNDVSLLRLALVRHPFWESPSPTYTYASLVSGWGGTYDFSGIGGDAWARLERTRLYGVGGSGPLYRTWMGIREELLGTNHFEPIWQLGGSTYYQNGAANSTARSGYSGPGHIRKTNPAATLELYVQVSVGAICSVAGHSDYNHQMGQYLVLCRCAVDAGTVGLQMRHGYGDSKIPSEEVFVTNTSWRLIELGRVTFPPVDFDLDVASDFIRYAEIEIYAEQVSGASVLDIDALCLVPTHHFWQTAGGNIEVSNAYSADIYTTPADRHISFGRGVSYPRYALEYGTENWYLPTGNSVAVVAAERETQHVLADDLGLWTSYCQRYGMYGA